MSDTNLCSRCRTPLPADAPHGICPQCEIQGALDVFTDDATHLADAASVPSGAAIGTNSAPHATPSTLHQFGDYQLLEEIARGGMGVVYKALQKSLSRVVAVKMILAGQFASKQIAQRFKSEAIAAAVLHHPNIVAVHEVGVHEGQHFFSMDYVEGQNLTQLVGNRPLPAHRAARYVKLIAEAINYAHKQGILHRDLKPSNVLIDAATDQPRVTDFGLAKRLDGESSLTVTGQVLGSPNFMPPEQASGARGKVGRHSDVYGLGGILYYLLTARAPFQADSLEALVTQVIHTEPISPQMFNAAVPPDLETVCLKCLQKETPRRYQNAQELADELGRFLDNEPVHARPIGPTAKLWRWCRRKPALATLGGIVLFLLLVVLLGAPIAIVRIDRARADASSARLEVERSLYAADMRLASQALRDGDTRQVEELLRAHEPRRGAEDLRGFEWRYLRQAADQSGLVTNQFQGVKSSSLVLTAGTLYNLREDTSEILAWNTTNWAPLSLKLPPQRKSERWWWYPAQQAALAVNDKDRMIAVYRLPNFEEASVISVPGKASLAAVSKDLRTLAVGFQDGNVHGVLLWDMAANSHQSVFGEHPGKLIYLRFSPDGNVLVAAYNDGVTGLWSISEDKALPSPARDSSIVDEDWQRPPFFGPGSTRLFLNRDRERNTLEVWDWSTGKSSILYQAEKGGVRAFAFSLDGAVLVTAWGWGGEVVLFDVKESRKMGPLPANSALILSLAFSPSGRFIASGSQDRTAKLWDVKTQRELATLGDNDDSVRDVAFTPDEKSVITLTDDGQIKVWDLGAVRGQGVLWSTPGQIKFFIVSADDRAIATTDGAGWIHVWDLVSGREIGRIHSGEPGGFDISFSPTDHIVAWAGTKWLGILDYDSGQTNIFPLPRIGWHSPAFSPDGRELAFADSTNIMLLDMATRRPRPFAIKAGVFGLAFSPNGLLLASAHGDGTLTLWDRMSGRIITNAIAHPPFAMDVEFSPDGRLLSSGGWDAIGKLWDVLPGGLKLRNSLRGSIGGVGLVFSPDGRRVVSGGADRNLKLWDTKTGLEVGTLYSLGGNFAFSHDGNAIYSAGERGEVRVWRAPPLDRLDAPVKEKKVKP